METTEVKLLKELDFGNFAQFKKTAQGIAAQVTTKPTTLIFVLYLDTLKKLRKNPCNGDFIPGLGLDLRVPQLESYHSGVCDTSSGRVMDIRFSTGTANKALDAYKQGVSPDKQLKEYDRRPNLVYYRYELSKKRSIYLFTERRLYTTICVPKRDWDTVESIKTLQYMTQSPEGLSLHPFWMHMILLYHVIKMRTIRLQPQKSNPQKPKPPDLFSIEARLLNQSLIELRRTADFGPYIQDLHEILRTLITLEHSHDQDIILIDNLLADLASLSNETSALGAEFTLDTDSEARVKSAFLCLRNICMERRLLYKNRKQRAQNLVELLYNLTTNRDTLVSLEIAQKNGDIARDAKKESE